MDHCLKKLRAAILIFDICVGLLLFTVYANKLKVECPQRDIPEVKQQQGSLEQDSLQQRKLQQSNLKQGSLEQDSFQQGSLQQRKLQQSNFEQESLKKDSFQQDSLQTNSAGSVIGSRQNVKKIALTFDDGPHPYYTEQLLDGLKERKVVATFFVTGEHAVLHPDVIKRMKEEGHLIGNHTYSHMQLRSCNKEEFKEELIATSEVIEEIIGEEVSYVRPPYGTWDKGLEEELNMIPVLWNIDPLDWCSDNADCVASRVVEKAEENAIILMHDYYESTVTAALEVVDTLQEEGYVFVTVEEILFN
ncbi:MAG: polysaccharide deacetylase family protein [Lachnospiraceae bacterium]|nr:polysaccharide deacetylase family protein [Lachnospiraceae bacterium]